MMKNTSKDVEEEWEQKLKAIEDKINEEDKQLVEVESLRKMLAET